MEKPSRSSPTVKPPGEAKALELLQQHASQYKSKSPSTQDAKPPHEREREGPISSPSQRMLPTHHHLSYPLLSGQYDLSYASGETGSACFIHIRFNSFNSQLLSKTMTSSLSTCLSVSPYPASLLVYLPLYLPVCLPLSVSQASPPQPSLRVNKHRLRQCTPPRGGETGETHSVHQVVRTSKPPSVGGG